MSRPQGLVGGAISLQGRPTLAWRPQSQGRWTRTGRWGGPREPQPRHQSPPSQLPEAVVTTGCMSAYIQMYSNSSNYSVWEGKGTLA